MKHLAGALDRVKTPFYLLRTSERGVTGLETAIILIAFVVVASVFAFTVLSTGIFSAERGKETVFAGLEQARGSVELKGSVIANGVVDVEMDDADDVWAKAGGALVTLTVTTDTTDKKEGTAAGEIQVNRTFSTGLLAYEDLSPTKDISSYDSISFWVKSTVNTTAGQLELVIDDSTGCASASEAIDLPVLTASTWELITVGITDSTTRTAVACIGLQVTGTTLSSTAEVTVFFDDAIANGQVTSLDITIANSVEGEPVDLTGPTDADSDGIADTEDRIHKLIISYQDATQLKNDLYWTKSFIGDNDSDELMEEGERADITVQLEGLDQATPLLKSQEFTIEIKPSEGSVLSIQRETPAKIDLVMNLK